MKLATFMYKNQEKWGFILPNPDDDQLWIYEPTLVQQQLRKVGENHTNYYYISLRNYARNFPYPDTLTAFLEQEEAGMDALQKLVTFTEHFLQNGDRYAMAFAGHPLAQVKLRCPIPRPRLFLGLVRNCPAFWRNKLYIKNISTFPVMHQRPISALIGEDDIKPVIGTGGGNVELGFVVGKRGKNIPIEEAHKYIAGYTIVIDEEFKYHFDYLNAAIEKEYGPGSVAKQNVGLESSNCGLLGKSSDACCAAGPYIVTPDEVGNPYDLLVYTGQNDRIRDRSHTASITIGAERLISWYSTIAEVHPGDIFHLGTAGTDGIFMDQAMRETSTTIFSEIERVGRLQIRVAGSLETLEKAIADKGYPFKPALNDLICAGKDEIQAPEDWKLEDMNNIWISCYNHKQCAQLDNYPIVNPYPKAFCSPRTSVGMDGGETVVNIRSTTLTVGLELGFVIKKAAYQVYPTDWKSYVLGFTPVLSVADRSIREEFTFDGKVPHGFVDLYARWGDKYNTVKTPQALEDISCLKMTLTVDGVAQTEATTEAYIHMPKKFLEFMTISNTLFPGDIITMSVGTARITIPEGTDINGVRIRGHIDGLGEVTTTLRKEIATPVALCN